MERHFTYAQIKEFLLSVFLPIDGETVQVTEVQLMTLYGFSRPLWLATHERVWPHHTQKGTSLLTETMKPERTIRLAFVLGDRLPYGLPSPEQEDAEIERARRHERELRIAAESAEPEVFLPGEEALHEEEQA